MVLGIGVQFVGIQNELKILIEYATQIYKYEKTYQLVALRRN